MRLGSITKTPAEIRRIMVSFAEWADPGETITSLGTPHVEASVSGGWPGAGPGPGPWPPGFQAQAAPLSVPVVADATPLTIYSLTVMPDALTVYMLVANGTDGLAYSVTFTAHGTSGRVVEQSVTVEVRSNNTVVVH